VFEGETDLGGDTLRRDVVRADDGDQPGRAEYVAGEVAGRRSLGGEAAALQLGTW
jgi:hypothetical protein